MKLIKSSYNILDQEPGLDGIYKQIEKAGRTCYMSSDKITEDSAKKFVDMLIKRGHTSVLEHGTIYLYIKDYFNPESSKVIAHYAGTGCVVSTKFSVDRMETNPYSKYIIRGLGLHGRQAYITTNYRVLYENNWLDDLKYLCEPTEYHEKRVTVRFVLPISISREFCRHRVFSFAEQSTRYCNYNADKFNNELTFIIPYWADLKEARYAMWDDDWVDASYKGTVPDTILKHFERNAVDAFLATCEVSELSYKELINKGCKPQEAREILPLCTKTELVMTGFVSDWQHFFNLRCDRAAHPQAQELAIPLREKFKQYLNW